MAGRLVNPTPRFLSRLRALGVETGSSESRAIARTANQLASTDVLPGGEDVAALIPPTQRALVRRVRGMNLWIWYEPRGELLVLLTLTRVPPPPVDA